MVARDHSKPSGSELDQQAYENLMRRSALAAQVGPYRRTFGAKRQISFAAVGGGTKQLSSNGTRDRVLFVTVSVFGTEPIVFNNASSDGASGLRLTFSDNVPGSNVNYMDFILFPEDALFATSISGAVLQINEQTF